MLALSDIAGRSQPLSELLHDLCEKIARFLQVDVCSIYALDLPRTAPSLTRELNASGLPELPHDELVMIATYGFPPEACFLVHMPVGQGLTGFAVECLRPVSVAKLAKDARNMTFAGLDEERFPAFCALPLAFGGRPVGALVVQRKESRAFADEEIVMLAATAAPVLLALESARTRGHVAQAMLREVHRTHDTQLHGRGLAPHRRLGILRVLARSSASLGRVAGTNSAPGKNATVQASGRHVSTRPVELAAEAAKLASALTQTAAEMADLERWAAQRNPALRALIAPMYLVAEDARLREQMHAALKEGGTAGQAVERVMTESIRSLSDPTHGARDRAAEVEAFCLRLAAALGDLPRLRLHGAVLMAARLSACDLLELARHKGCGVALCTDDADAAIVSLAKQLQLPLVSGLQSLPHWAKDGDTVLIDGDKGSLTINPSRLVVADYRRRGRDELPG